jgi:Holliday junction DNA helicase RuvA
MIGRIAGRLLQKNSPFILVDVHGVGYEMEAPLSTFYQLPELGAEVVLRTHLIVREDAHLLYAFFSETERSLFRVLLKINGVGAKLALTILSGLSAEELSRCVAQNDLSSLTRLPGVGKKTAERLVVELRDKLKDFVDQSSEPVRAVAQAPSSDNARLRDAVSALVALGYKPPEAQRMVQGLSDQFSSSEEIIRAALRKTMREPA